RCKGQGAGVMGMLPLPNANTIEVVKRIRAELEGIKRDLPKGLAAGIAYDASEYIRNAIHEVVGTLTDTLIIVVVVIFLFLGSFRSVLVPVIAIPVSLIGGELLIEAFGFTLTLLTLLALGFSAGLAGAVAIARR